MERLQIRQKLLIGILSDEKALVIPKWRQHQHDARKVDYDPMRWLGVDDIHQADRMKLSRELSRMEDEGLIKVTGDRASEVMLTDAGRVKAMELRDAMATK